MSFATAIDTESKQEPVQTLRQALMTAMSKSKVPVSQITATINALGAANVNLDGPASEGSPYLSVCPPHGH